MEENSSRGFSSKRKELIEKSNQLKVRDSNSMSSISDTAMNRIIEDIKNDRKCNDEEAFTALALLSQMGGTSARAQTGVEVTVGNTTFNIETIRKIIKKVTGKNLRRLAKTYASSFYEISKIHKFRGNLYNKITSKYKFKLENPDDIYWISDFQGENHECPQYIRDQLIQYYNEHIESNKPKKKKSIN